VFPKPLSLKWGVWGNKMGEGWCDVYLELTRFLLLGFYVCANFGESPSINASVRVHADGHTDRGKLVL